MVPLRLFLMQVQKAASEAAFPAMAMCTQMGAVRLEPMGSFASA